MDIFRGFFNGFMLYMKFTNYYRYDHIINKPNVIYEYEKTKIALNLPNKSQENKRIQKYALIYDKMKEKLFQ